MPETPATEWYEKMVVQGTMPEGMVCWALVLGILAEDVLCQHGYQINGIFVAEYKRYFLPCCLEFIT